MKAVRFDQYGPVEVLDVRDVPVPEPGPGEVLVRVKAAGINPGEAKIREGALHERWPATFPSGQGSDFAGVVEKLGPGVATVAIGAVDLKPGDTVVVSGAAGGVGAIAVQLARRKGATVIGLAGPSNHDWLTRHGVIPVAYGDDVAERIRAVAPAGAVIDAFLDTYGGDYVEVALNDLKVSPERVDTIVRFDAAAKYGVKVEGNAAGASAATLAELANLIAAKELEVPLAHTYPLSDVRTAYAQLARGHVRGKIVLIVAGH